MILALESSCDETAVAGFAPERGFMEEWVHSQISLHERYGGVVPELATREHLRTLVPLLERARQQPWWGEITQVAVTQGPGLAGCLAIGLAAAKALAWAWRVPLVGVNHLRGHAFSPFIGLQAAAPAAFAERCAALLPHLGLIVSGGNTLLFSLDTERRLHVLGATRDDAAGEALDKGAKLLGLGYPGGPLIERVAVGGQADAFAFPRSLGQSGELAFSFSGLKTSLRYLLEKMSPAEIARRLPDLCASYQAAVVDALVRKTAQALAQGSYRSLGCSGGVANNRRLRQELARVAEHRRLPFLAAQPRHTGDNAGMIAFAAWADPTVAPVSCGHLSISPALELEKREA